MSQNEKNINFLNKYLNGIQGKSIRDIIEETFNNSTIDSNSPEGILMGYIENNHKELHKSVLDKFNIEIFNKLGSKYSEEINTIKEKYNKKYREEYGDTNPSLEKKVNNTINTMIYNKVYYKFFEYKYIQLNLFILLFIKKLLSTMNIFTTKLTNDNNELFETFAALINQLSNKEDTILTVKEINDIEKKINENISNIKTGVAVSFNEAENAVYKKNNDIQRQSSMNAIFPNENEDPTFKGLDLKPSTNKPFFGFPSQSGGLGLDISDTVDLIQQELNDLNIKN